MEAVDRFAEAGVATRFLQLRTLWPFPEEELQAFIRDAEHIFIVENTFTGQLARLIKVITGPLPHMHSVLKYNGKPFRPIEVIEAVGSTANVRSYAEV